MALGMCGGPAVPVVGLQRGMDLLGDDAAFCQITLTSCFHLLVSNEGPDGLDLQVACSDTHTSL